MFTIAIVGKSNVGKSTLFNKLAGKSIAIVGDITGLTRDRKETIGKLGDLEFKIIDTAGWIITNNDKNDMNEKMNQQTQIAITNANLCLFMVDFKNGLDEIDNLFAKKIRELNISTILVINKCESMRNNEFFDNEFYKLGFKNIVGISAEHKDGFNTLYDIINKYYQEYKNKNDVKLDEQIVKDDVLQLAIVGRPNVGKSTLVNQLLGENRVITDNKAGTTRDAIGINWTYKNKKIKLFDTAGIRKKKNISESVENMSVEDSFRAIKFSQVVIMMIDSTSAFDSQDLSIISMIVKEGRGVVFAINKWDLVKDKSVFIDESIKLLSKLAPEVKGCPVIPISALNGNNINKLMNAVFDVSNDWNKYISTSKLNNWLKKIQAENSPPLFRKNPVKLKYITQAKKRPPTFILFTNAPEKLEKTKYSRFLMNSLRRDFKIDNSMVRLFLRKIDNPYYKKN